METFKTDIIKYKRAASDKKQTRCQYDSVAFINKWCKLRNTGTLGHTEHRPGVAEFREQKYWLSVRMWTLYWRCKYFKSLFFVYQI